MTRTTAGGGALYRAISMMLSLEGHGPHGGGGGPNRNLRGPDPIPRQAPPS